MTTSTITRIGKYEITGVLGQGGMGVVYRAVDKRIGREVAIKTLTEGYAGHQEMLERLVREATQAGILQHPNIVIVYDVGDLEGVPYIVMEYVRGDTLEQIIPSRPSMAMVEKLHIIAQVCNALNYAHQKGIVHRDIKPGNVMVQPDGLVKLVDFGIARQENPDLRNMQPTLTRAGNVIGSLNYIAPERLKNGQGDGRSDIFSTGILLYQFLTGGILPFDCGDDYATANEIVNSPHPPLGKYLAQYPPEFDGILNRALAKNPDDRYPTAAQFEADLVALRDTLKEQRISELYRDAQSLSRNAELDRARDVLLQILRIDSHHTGARSLLSEVQQNLAQQQRANQVRELRAQAEDAMGQKLYQEAVQALQQAVKLSNNDAELNALLAAASEAKKKKEELQVLLREAEQARGTGDLEAAMRVARRAVALDPADTHAKALFAGIAKESDERVRQKKARELMESAQQEIAARRFTKAFEMLREAEEVDAGLPELHAMMNQARMGREQDLRRVERERISAQFNQSVEHEDYAGALALANEGLKKFPTDPAMLRLQALGEKHLREQEAKRFIDDQVQAIHNLLKGGNAGEALALTEKTMLKAPRDSRLLSLRKVVQDEIARLEVEKKKSALMEEAKLALQNKDYGNAARALEAIQASGELSPEIADLLEFARSEAAAQERHTRLDEALVQGQKFLGDGNYEKAVEVLEAAVKQYPDDGLQLLLDQAREGDAQIKKKLGPVLQQSQELAAAGQLEQALALLAAQPAGFQQLAAVREAQGKLRERMAAEQAVRDSIQKAQALLQEGNIVESLQILRTTYQTYGESEILKQALIAFEAQRKTLAQDRVQQAVREAQSCLQEKKYQQAFDLISQAADFVPFVSPELSAEYKRLGNEASDKVASLPRPKDSGKKKTAPPPDAAKVNAPKVSAPVVNAPPVNAQKVAPPVASGSPVAAVAKEKLPAQPKPAAPVPAKVWISSIAVVVVLLVGGVIWALRKPAPQPKQPVPAPIIQPLTYVELNAVPWGKVVKVALKDGKEVPVGQETPVRLEVPPGKLTMTVAGPDGQETPKDCEISATQHSCTQVFPSVVDIEKLVGSAK